ncbi:MAG TPA: hypothetical protein DIT04_06005 [Dysgonomonas sp.]|nr:hypothetical protein [Dysgonomonas sp.]
MKSENIILFEEQSFEYKGWIIHIEKNFFSFLRNTFSVKIVMSESYYKIQPNDRVTKHKPLFRISIKTKLKWIDLLGNNKKMFDECISKVRRYIDETIGDASEYLSQKASKS